MKNIQFTIEDDDYNDDNNDNNYKIRMCKIRRKRAKKLM